MAGGRCPPDPPVFGWGAKPPQTPPLNGRSSHLIEAAKRGRLDQMIFFSAPLTTQAPPTTVQPDARRHARRDVAPDPNQKPVSQILIMEAAVTTCKILDAMDHLQHLCKIEQMKKLQLFEKSFESIDRSIN